MSQVDEIMQLVYAYEAAPNDEYAAQHDALKAAIEELDRLMDVRKKQHDEREDVISDLRCELETLKAEHDALKSAIEELVSEVEYNKQHTLVECPQCGFTGAREYAPLEKTP